MTGSAQGAVRGLVRGSPMVHVSLAWAGGVVAGGGLGGVGWWLVLGAVLLGFSVCMAGWARCAAGVAAGRWPVWAYVVGLAALACVSASWRGVQCDYTDQETIARYVGDERALARVRGRVASIPRDVVPQQDEGLGAFSYREPGTLFTLEADSIDAGRGWEPASGRVLVSVWQQDHRPQWGQRIEATGWLSAVGPTQNPGEFDYRAYLQREGVFGRLTLVRRGNWRPLAPPPRWTLTGVRRGLGDAAAASLGRGLPHDPVRSGLLEALLLGRRGGDLDDLNESFRAVGLAHVLSISGAHLGILLLLVWALGRCVIGRPAWVACLVLVALAVFLLVVPWRTPIIRAAIMSGVFSVGYGMGRRLRGIEMLAGAALIVLIWKPGDLFTAGFQLSFGAVGGILLWTRPLSLRVWPEPEVRLLHPTAAQQTDRWLIDFVCASLVAFLVALPLVMYHFRLLSPLAALLSMLALPVLTGLLGVGYLKILLGLALPSASSLLAWPTVWLADCLVALVEQSRRMPAATVPLQNPPSGTWTAGALAFIIAWLAGGCRGRRVIAGLALCLVIGWAWVEQRPSRPPVSASALEVVMFGVGDGSCYLVQSGGEAAMYDCGSQAMLQVGERSIVPALRELGVTRLSFLMLSHPDLDHFAGALDVVDAVEVGRVIVSAAVMREAAEVPGGAAAYLVASLRERGHEPVVAGRGWTQKLGRAECRLLWPIEGFESEHHNNHSLVLRVALDGRRVLFNGDIQGDAIDAILARGIDLRAEVSDLAHHGSWVDQSPAWFEAVSPRLVLQSSGPRRPERDRWARFLEERGVPRLGTEACGMVRVVLAEDGRLVWDTHRGGAGEIPRVPRPVADELVPRPPLGASR